MTTVLLSGATGKFGSRLFHHYLGKGWQVIAIASDSERLKDLLESAGKQAACDGIAIDLSLDGAPESAINQILDRGYRINHLINLARRIGNLTQASIGFETRASFIREFDLAVSVPYTLAMTLVSKQANELSSIVNVGSQYGIVASNPELYEGNETLPIHYSCAKAAVMQLTREMAVRLAGNAVRVNCVAFGGVEGRVDKEFMNRYESLTPSKRMLREEEIVGPFDFLTSEASSSVTGHTLVADGGWTIW